MRLFSELKRRNVYRMALLYLGAAWLIMQVVDLLIDRGPFPESLGPITLTVLAIGFPIALVLSWFYELTPEGLALEKDVTAGKSITHVTGRRMDFIVIALLCAALVVFAYDKWWNSGPPITSVAVLPLENLSSDPEQVYFVDAMTEVLTAQLAQIQSLRVASRTSAAHYKTTEMSLPDIASELGVDAIVEGSVQPTGDQVRFTLQLIDGRTDRHLWSKSYLRELRDVLTLQGEVARDIATEIEVALTPESETRLVRNRTVDPNALRFWLVGNQHMRGLQIDSFDKALRAFEESIRYDPEFANAHAGVAQVQLYFGGWHGNLPTDTALPMARAAAEKAIRLDPDLAEAHFALGQVHVLEWNWNAAIREYRKGVELNPSDSTGLSEFANFLGAMGQFDEAVRVAMRAVEIDPLSPATHNELGLALWLAGDHDAALAKYQYALQLDPEFFQTQWILADYHVRSRDYDRALPYLEDLTQDYESLAPVMIGMVASMNAMAGRRDEAREMLSYLLQRTESEYIPGSALAYAYSGLEEYDEAMNWLEVAYEQRDNLLIWLREEPFFDGLRGDARFQDLVARMNFPDLGLESENQKL